MLSKNTVKFIKSLHLKKFRKDTGFFFVEGAKIVRELLSSDYEITHLLYTEKFASSDPKLIESFHQISYEVDAGILEKVGMLKTNDTVLAVAKCKENRPFQLEPEEWILALDDVRDPGNLGTIIRIADWYGINKLLLSRETADFYNPKVLQASMGSFIRVQAFYDDLEASLKESNLPMFGAFLEGENLYEYELPKGGILLMGNESRGINEGLASLVKHKIHIPRRGEAESLNVAVATGIICDHIARARHFQKPKKG